MLASSKEAKTRAEASFKKKEHQAQEGAKAWEEYEAERRAVLKKTERLKSLRVAKEAAGAASKDKELKSR